jgi:hypothetical protein
VQAKRERSHDAEVTTTSTHGPEEVRVLGRACCESSSIGKDNLDSEQAIDGQTIFARKLADPATEREAAKTNTGEVPNGDRQATRFGCPQELPTGETGLGPGNASLGVHLHAFHWRKVDDQPLITDAVPAHAVTSSTNRDRQVLTARKLESADDISNLLTAKNEGRMLINQPIPDLAGTFIAFVALVDQFAMQMRLEIAQICWINGDVRHSVLSFLLFLSAGGLSVNA